MHQMGGFDRTRVADVLDTSDDVVPLVVLALGRRDGTVRLAGPLAERETAARERLPRESLLVGITPAAADAAAAAA